MLVTAGILLYRRVNKKLEVFIVHPGGPFWAKKDNGVWSIPKGMPDHGELVIDAAIREFYEETGCKINVDKSSLLDLGELSYNAAKNIHCFALEKDIGDIEVASNLFYMEWPPKSGNMQQYPETDIGAYFDIDTAKVKVVKHQIKVLEKLEELLKS